MVVPTSAGGWLGCVLAARIVRFLEQRGPVPAKRDDSDPDHAPVHDPDLDDLV